MNATDIIESLFRWIHVVAGVLWIGLLYFFNWVNGPFAATLDADSKKKVVPELMPRALYFFRWGAAYTWVTGVLLLLLVFYHGGALLEDPSRGWSLGAVVMLAVVFLAPFLYDVLLKIPAVTKTLTTTAIVGFVLITAVVFLMISWAGFSYRGYVIHLGTMFGTIMAFNVWFRIWPSQRQIITAVKNGQAPDPNVVALAGLRSRHNTFLSIPLIWTMFNVHTLWASSSWIILPAIVLIGWIGVKHIFKLSGKVKGF